MLDRHAVHALLKAGHSTKEIAKQFGVSRRTMQRIAKEPAVEEADDDAARRRRGVGRPSVPEAVQLELRNLISADREAPPPEPYLHPHVLVIDELGYQSYAADAANVLFRVVSQRHLRRRPILVTTNRPLAALGQVLHDGDLAEAILDRLLERGTHFVLRGRSYRTRHFKEDARTEAAEDAA